MPKKALSRLRLEFSPIKVLFIFDISGSLLPNHEIDSLRFLISNSRVERRALVTGGASVILGLFALSGHCARNGAHAFFQMVHHFQIFFIYP